MNNPVLIQKEEIKNIRFPKEDVLLIKSETLIRDRALNNALLLGNLEHGKVKLTFLDYAKKMYQVETTVWAVTEESVCLKGDLLLPKRSLLSVGY
ncbi:hypothetical protein MM239_14310 [Belliella sp. DSM 111904]|uniref:Uncharacterized protein n=1 Tax=Belliella filtrata TaxID=2923435 RepID=A0ABS9V2D0_9BACT|nr:hypothetical protein [Belliella filtrata]MCH7410577.1 hypothetical protein [Belliella filtrata]